MTLAKYAARNIAELIDQAAKASAEAAKDASEECIHDLRVAIRRLSETLRVFEDLAPADTAATVRKELREAMHLAGSIRNHDVASELANKASVKVGPSFGEERERAARELGDVLNLWNRTKIFAIWRKQLRAPKAS